VRDGGFRAAGLRQSEVENLHSTVRPDLDIRRHEPDSMLHIKDRKKNHGANLPLGEGETPIKAVLQLLKHKKYPIPANIEYEYGKPGMDTVAQVRKCFDYCKRALPPEAPGAPGDQARSLSSSPPMTDARESSNTPPAGRTGTNFL
jgi:hypothetical protein